MCYKSVFGGVPGAAAPPAQPGLPNLQQGFAGGAFKIILSKLVLTFNFFNWLDSFYCVAAPSTNPFVAAGMVQEPMSTNPFQTNGRAAASGKT